MKYVGIALALILVGGACFSGGFYQGKIYQESMAIKQDKENWEKNVAEIDDLIARQNQTMGVMMDTQIRIFHYAKPHTAAISFCPECFEIMQRAKKDPKVIEDEFKKLEGLGGTKKPVTAPNAPADSKPAPDTKPATKLPEAKPATEQKPAETKPPMTDTKPETKK